MGAIAKFVYGGRTLNINDGTNYRLGQGFTPPAVNLSLNIANGTSANRSRGGEVTGRRANDRGWAFTIHIHGGSVAEIHNNAQRLQAFLDLAYDKNNTLYFVYRPDTNYTITTSHDLSPLWGQNPGEVRYQVKSGMVDESGSLYEIINKGAVGFVVVSLTLAPYGEGYLQKAASASGGVYQDTIGMADGFSRGVVVPEATVNKMTNPIFGHSVPLTNWSVAAAVNATVNTDKEFVLFGQNSVRVSKRNAGASFLVWQSINVGNTNAHILSCYVKAEDSGNVSSTDVELFYDSDELTTAFQSVGNGWWRMTASLTGAASAKNTGIQLHSGQAMYFDGFQLEEKDFATPLCSGDMLGCVWAGTAHESTTTRTVGKLKIPVGDALPLTDQFMIRVVTMPHMVYSADAYYYLYDARDGTKTDNPFAYFNYTDNKFYFSDGTASLTSAAQTYAARTPIVFHYVVAGSSQYLYVNGALADTDDFVRADVQASHVFLGSHNRGTFGGQATIMDFAVYDIPLGAPSILADYNNVYALISDNKPSGYIPFWWTKDGDDVLDNGDLTTVENWGIVGGIAGNAPAKTIIRVQGGAEAEIGTIYLSHLDMPYNQYERPDFLIDNGAPDTISVDTTDTTITSITFTDWQNRLLNGRELAAIVRGRVPTTNNLLMRTGINAGGGLYYSDYYPVSFVIHGSNISIDMAPFISMPSVEPIFNELSSALNGIFRLEAKRASGGAENFIMTFVQIVPRPLSRVSPGSAYRQGAYYVNGQWYIATVAGEISSSKLTTTGDPIELLPGRYNALIMNRGAEAEVTTTGDDSTVTVWVAPRWTLA